MDNFLDIIVKKKDSYSWKFEAFLIFLLAILFYFNLDFYINDAPSTSFVYWSGMPMIIVAILSLLPSLVKNITNHIIADRGKL